MTWTSRRWSGVWMILSGGMPCAVRIARLGEQAPGLLEVEALVAGLAEARVEEEAHRRVDRAVGGRAAAELRLLDVALAIERLGDRKPHLEAVLLHQLLERLVEVG